MPVVTVVCVRSAGSDVCLLQVLALSALLAVCQAGLLPVAAPHYSSAAAVSSQSIVRHDQHAAPAKLVAAPVAYQAAPLYHSAPVYQSAPVYHAAPAPVLKYAAHHEQEIVSTVRIATLVPT